ncbi:MAG: hypothetical protein VBE63_16380 [Lamprobacter sp.]|uniref:hypothetical protein n=1 Tax=Lamprobacter sp. TaxID=3100796 RepID=UPI002B25DB1E|nr:hypothetical protein [Lamprobacter sp.]MEA3641500.1 hypothetical protein [Lamprobacter sp.]
MYKRVLLFLLVSVLFSNSLFAREELCSAIVGTVGVNPQSAINNIGKPLSRKVTNVQNRHEKNTIDKTISLEYLNGYIAFYYLTKHQEYLFEGAKLERANFNSTLNSVIPQSERQFKQMYGEPDESKPGIFLYYCGFEETRWVEIFHNNEVITGFEFVGYIG